MMALTDRNTNLVLVYTFLSGVAFALYFFILPIHIRDLGASPSQVGLTLSISYIPMLLAFPFAGYLSTWMSRRKLLLLFALVPVVPALLLANAASWQMLLLLLIPFNLQAASAPIFNSYILHMTGREKLGRVLGLTNFTYMLGHIIFRSVGAGIAERYGMELVFILTAVVFLLSAIPTLGLQEQTADIGREKTNYRQLLRGRPFTAAAAFNLCLLFIFFTGVSLIPNYLKEVVGLRLSAIGQMGSIFSLGGAIFSLLLGRLSGNWGLRGALALMFGTMSILLWLPHGAYLPIAFLMMGSMGASFPLTDALIGRVVDPKLSGLGFGMQSTLVGLAQTIGPLAAGHLYEGSPGWPMLFAVCTLPFIVLTSFALPGGLEIDGKEVSTDGE